MPLRAKDKYGRLTYIDNAIQGDMYYCQICNQPMMQRHCVDRIDHFAHYSPHGNNNIVPCSDHWGYDKTEWHMEWQKRFPVDNMERVLELHGKKHIADVLVDNIVVEFQHSPISLEEFSERNEFYTNLGYKVIWVFDLIEEYDDGRLAQNDYEWYYKWAHAKKLFRNISLENVKATIYFQLSDDTDPEVGVIERVKEIHDDGRLVKTDSKCCFSIKEFVEKISSNSRELFERPKAPNSIENCDSIAGLWDESYSFMIVRNKHTSDVFYVFGKDGYLIRDYRSGKVRCKYAYQDPTTGLFKEKDNYYNIPDEDKKIWILIRSFKDKGYEERVARHKQEQERIERERKAKQQEMEQLKSAEQEGCHTIFQLCKNSNGKYLYVDNVLTGKSYFVKLVNSYQSINIYEVDKNNIAVILAGPLNAEMSKLYQYKVWKLADIL